MRTLPVSSTPSAVVTRADWPTFTSRMRAFGHFGTPLDAALAQQAQHFAARLRDLADDDRARRDHAVIGRNDARVAEFEFRGGEIRRGRFHSRARGEIFALQALALRARTRRPSLRATPRDAGSTTQ